MAQTWGRAAAFQGPSEPTPRSMVPPHPGNAPTGGNRAAAPKPTLRDLPPHHRRYNPPDVRPPRPVTPARIPPAPNASPARWWKSVLAACVNLLPGVTSVYHWQGQVERAEEVQLLIKTTSERLPLLMARVQALHPYELPEAIAVRSPRRPAGLPGLGGRRNPRGKPDSMPLLRTLVRPVRTGDRHLPGPGHHEADLLPVEQGLRPERAGASRERIEISWKIADGYYLYRHRTSVTVEGDSFLAGPLQLPAGHKQHDEFFGDVETYRGKLDRDSAGHRRARRRYGHAEVKYQAAPNRHLLSTRRPVAYRSSWPPAANTTPASANAAASCRRCWARPPEPPPVRWTAHRCRRNKRSPSKPSPTTAILCCCASHPHPANTCIATAPH